MTGAEALAKATAALSTRGIDGAARDARRLLAYVLDIDAGRVTLVLPDALSTAQVDRFETLVERRGRREPVSHLIGSRQFYGRGFEVGADVLDPRPETEELVAAALTVGFGRVLDLGTGSGCILTTLLAERGADAFGVGTDLSAAALAVAGRNANTHGVADRAQFIQGDWFGALSTGQADFDLIVSNPPYISADEMLGLAPEVRDFEPRIALTDEADGLTAYRIIARDGQEFLRGGGWLMVEIGASQGAAVKDLFSRGGFVSVSVRADLDGRDRVVMGQKPRIST